MREESLRSWELTRLATRMLLNSGSGSRDLEEGPLKAPGKTLACKDAIIGKDDLILVTGAAGFIGPRVVQNLLGRGYTRLRCLVRHSSDLTTLRRIVDGSAQVAHVEIMTGNLLSRQDCNNATRGVAVVYHLAAGTGTKSFSDAYMNSVVTTRNLLDATLQHKCLRRMVNLSSFAVYAGTHSPRWAVLDENFPMESQPERRAEAYCYAKVKQDELVMDYGRTH